MVLILSESTDVSTDIVIDWLRRFEIEFFRINDNDIAESVFIDEDYFELLISGKLLKSDKITSFWHRRGTIRYKFSCFNAFSEKNIHLTIEWEKIKEYILHRLKKMPGIYNLSNDLNKLIVLDLAKEVGLNIPPFLVTDSEIELNVDYITKSVGDSYVCDNNGVSETFYTEKISKIPFKNFFASLLQQQVKSIYEIRTVILNGMCWSMAIHNYGNAIDYRKCYGKIRYSPYKLSEEIEIKLIALFDLLHLKFGAVDLMVDENYIIYFLEINPVGQFGMVSYPCNYNIEKEIAIRLK